MPCKEKILKLCCNWNWQWISRFFFVVFVVTQCTIFAEYVRIHSSKEYLIALLAMAALVLIPWAGILLCCPKKQLSRLWIVWTMYVIVLAFFIAYIFGWLREKLDRKNFWGPNNLKITVCLTPVIAIVLIATAKDAREYGDLVHRFYGGLVLELFDAIEVLAIVISPQAVIASLPTPAQFNSSLNSTALNCISNVNTVKLPNGLIIAIIVLALLSLVLSPLEMAENKLAGDGEHKVHRKLYLCRLVVKKLLVNLALMIVRLVAWLTYKHEASIFIVKNATIIVVAMIGILKYQNWCGLTMDKNN